MKSKKALERRLFFLDDKEYKNDYDRAEISALEVAIAAFALIKDADLESELAHALGEDVEDDSEKDGPEVLTKGDRKYVECRA